VGSLLLFLRRYPETARRSRAELSYGVQVRRSDSGRFPSASVRHAEEDAGAYEEESAVFRFLPPSC
jgi:hypothetical protein